MSLGVIGCNRKRRGWTAHTIARTIWAASSIYIALTSLAVWVVEGHRFRPNNIYYLMMVVLIALSAGVSLRRRSREAGRPADWLVVAWIFVAGAITWGLYRYPQLYSGSLWIDEITQFLGDQNLPRFVEDPARFAAIQQQPPIDYYLSAFARNFLGNSEPAVLFHCILFGLLSFLMFLLWLIQIRFPAGLAPIPIVIFAAHHSLLRFSSEARPISLGVFFSLTTLFFAHESLRRRRVSVALLGGSALLLLNSVGLQPIFFLAVLSIAFAPVVKARLDRKEAAKFLTALFMGPIALFLPTLWEIYRESKGQDQFFSGPFFEILRENLFKLEWISYAPFVTTLNRLGWVVFIPAVFFCLLVCFRSRVGDGRHRVEAFAWVAACAAFVFFFPLFFLISWGFINWYLHPYYVVLWVVGLLALTSQSVAYTWNIFFRASRGCYGAGMIVAAGLAGAYLLDLHFARVHREMVKRERSDRPDWHVIVDRARGQGKPVTIVEIPYGRFGWGPYHGLAGRFYEGEGGVRVLRLEDWSRENHGVQRFNIDRAAKESEGRALWFLWSVNNPPGDDLPLDMENRVYHAITEVTGVPTRVAQKVYLAEPAGELPPKKMITSVFAKIVESHPGSDRNFYLADALAAESIRAGNCGAARTWFQSMLESTSKIDKRAARYEGLRIHLVAVQQEIDSMPCTTPGRHGWSPQIRKRSLSGF